MKVIARHIWIWALPLAIFLSSYAVNDIQRPRIAHISDLMALMHRKTDTTYVINFWATWCDPCVHELPNFESLQRKYAGRRKIKVVLISLDFVKKIDTRLLPFLKDNNITSEVWLLDEPDYNSWIDKVSPQWSGSIPATLILNNASHCKEFYEKEFGPEELDSTIENFCRK